LDWPLFDSGFGCSAEDRDVVLPLTEAASLAVWNTYVSAKPVERHPMLLPSGHWLHPTKSGPNWVTEFNSDSEAFDTHQGKVAAFLRQRFELSNNERVFFVAMRERSYLLPIQFFVQHWPCFLASDDEGSFLFHPQSGKFAQFDPNGSLGFGTRSATNAA